MQLQLGCCIPITVDGPNEGPLADAMDVPGRAPTTCDVSVTPDHTDDINPIHDTVITCTCLASMGEAGSPKALQTLVVPCCWEHSRSPSPTHTHMAEPTLSTHTPVSATLQQPMARSAPWRPICTTMQTFAHSHLASSHAGTSVLPMSPAPRDDPVSCWSGADRCSCPNPVAPITLPTLDRPITAPDQPMCLSQDLHQGLAVQDGRGAGLRRNHRPGHHAGRRAPAGCHRGQRGHRGCIACAIDERHPRGWAADRRPSGYDSTGLGPASRLVWTSGAAC